MITSLEPERVSINDNGAIDLPAHLRQSAGLFPGDELLVVWLPPDTLILRKQSEIVADDKVFAAAMSEFDAALTRAGYGTDDEVLNLIQEIKLEQYNDWAAN
ncbi:MAG: AbrB/MazE/SpoVT family DNA-binding domain-containing protein [Caldilineaceae bacterium]|nr:AbrB/MazE/SpoVT family DNA-binding domain-containing protein [Caldilineaceae bacterium]